jgi:hypothetical protein
MKFWVKGTCEIAPTPLVVPWVIIEGLQVGLVKIAQSVVALSL